MHGHIIAHIYSRLQISTAESDILQTIAHAGNVFGQNAKLSYGCLSKRTGLSERWCKTLVHRLEEKALLRVERLRLRHDHHAINRYSVVRPWLREIDIRDALRKRITARENTTQMSSERLQHPDTTKKENLPPTPCTHAECVRMGLTPGSIAYQAARGLPHPDTPEGVRI